MDISAAQELILREYPAEEYDHFGKAAYRKQATKPGGKAGKTFVTLLIEEGHAVLMLTRDQQIHLMDKHPQLFTPHPGKWGEKGATIADLDRMDERVFREALDLAWGNVG